MGVGKDGVAQYSARGQDADVLGLRIDVLPCLRTIS